MKDLNKNNFVREKLMNSEWGDIIFPNIPNPLAKQ